MGQDDSTDKGQLHRITIWLGGAMLVSSACIISSVHRHMKKKSSWWTSRLATIPPRQAG